MNVMAREMEDMKKNQIELLGVNKGLSEIKVNWTDLTVDWTEQKNRPVNVKIQQNFIILKGSRERQLKIVSGSLVCEIVPGKLNKVYLTF